MPSLLAWFITVSYVILLFVLFRATDLESAGRVFAGLAGMGGLGTLWDVSILIPILAGSALALIKVPSTELVMRLRPNWPTAAAVTAAAVFCVLEVGKGQPQSFIYFQF